MDLDFSYLQDVLDASVAAVKGDRGVVQLLTEPQHKFYVAAQSGFSAGFLSGFPPSDPSDSTSAGGRAASLRQRVIVEDTEADASYVTHRAVAREAGYRTVNATPLISRNGKVLGVLAIFFNKPAQFSTVALRFLDGYARMAAMIIEAGRLKADLRRMEPNLNARISDVELKIAIRRLRTYPHNSPLVEQIWQLGDQHVTHLLAECERMQGRTVNN